MKIKRFLASSMREAMRQVREEQGPDAVILASHTRDNGVEVVAAVDYDEALMRQAVHRSETPAPAAPKAAAAPARKAEPARPPAPVADKPVVSQPPSREVEWAIDPQIRRLEDELSALRGLLESSLAATETRIAQAHPNRARLLALMEQLGFSPRIGHRIAATLPVDADDTRMPYQLPFPPDALAEIVVPKAIPDDERVWVPQAENERFGLLAAVVSIAAGFGRRFAKMIVTGAVTRAIAAGAGRQPSRSISSPIVGRPINAAPAQVISI